MTQKNKRADLMMDCGFVIFHLTLNQVWNFRASNFKKNNPSQRVQTDQYVLEIEEQPSTINDRFESIFNKENLSDVHFIVGTGKYRRKIPAHRLVLALGSPVFNSLFNDSPTSSSLEIEVPEIRPEIFLIFLKYLYCDYLEIKIETLMPLMDIAKKYQVPSLKNHCREFIKNLCLPENAFFWLMNVRDYDDHELTEFILKLICSNAAEAFKNDDFTDISHDILCELLKRDDLKMDEVDIFKLALRWAKAECIRQNLPAEPENQRQVLGAALFLIRFPLMRIKDFANIPAQSGILHDSEMITLFLYMTAVNKPPIAFSDVPREESNEEDCWKILAWS
ncbi:BTBD2 [Cordylochernes scorpioides]|uniref:BTBD2 n=1 Tax=Cordylochernes scorpioides TaxID=51811 RepID=A0ABY6LST2_9ARAC|nr:BTBD2 [Cordylochernes scorpioides]